MGEGWGEVGWLLLPVSMSDSGGVDLGFFFIFSCMLGIAGCKLAALNRGGAVARSFKSSFLGGFACRIWGSSQGRFSIVSLYVPNIGVRQFALTQVFLKECPVFAFSILICDDAG